LNCKILKPAHHATYYSKPPLNFVNNFSEVSAELVDEIREARNEKRAARSEKRDLPAGEAGARDEKQALRQNSGTEGMADEELEDEILEDIRQNLEKIVHHGKRADAIVKGMLEHSRTSSGEKVSTDINALADEYLRLSYHGMRAKDKSFNAEFHTDLDFTLPKINAIPQDIGRVLLNIINNAFQACAERQRGTYAEQSRSAFSEQRKSEKGKGIGTQNEPNPLSPMPYSPLVNVSTKNLGDKLEIRISDNGSGIPDAIKDKIFQPFFTTKPTGQGTGLGLSLSYDIVKAHGGELKLETTPGNGATFRIRIPKS
jgi:two-component system NtrC family sensor kinase